VLVPAAAVTQRAPQLNVGQFLQLRRDNLDLIHRAGLDQYVPNADPNALADKWITSFTSPDEAKSRIEAAQQAVFNEPLENRQNFQRMFGVGDSLPAATAYFLDPTNAIPDIQNAITAGELGGAAQRSSYGLLSRDEALQLARQGVTQGQAGQGFNKLATQAELFQGLPGEQGVIPITRAQQLAAQFGNDAASQQAIERQAAARRSVFGAGGGWNPSQGGVVGLGSATA